MTIYHITTDSPTTSPNIAIAMEQAWLDSLSEDWVSQPRSSGSPAPSLPSLTDNTSESSDARAKSSRIPKFNPQKKTWTATDSPLSERSSNEHNIPLPQRGSKNPSKLRDEMGSARGRHSRTISASTTHSTQCHTIQHKSTSLSPKRVSGEIPEWKRRLLHGDVAYGEQRDLFSPAGIENLFRPPQPQPPLPSKLQTQTVGEESIVMPSSPPPYNINRETRESEVLSDQGEEVEEQKRGKPRAMKYKLVNDEGSDFSASDLSRSSNFHPRAATAQSGRIYDSSMEGSVAQNGVGERTVSGQSDMRNEELSPIYVSRHNTIDGNIDFLAKIPVAEVKQRLEDIREDSPLQVSEALEDSSRIVLENTTADTDDFAHNGQFINTRRGGRSEEGSFQKRMLSPSSLPAIDESAMLPEESMQASTPKQLPNVRKTRTSNQDQVPSGRDLSPTPQTPHSSPSKPNERPHETSSGSPLKIFDTYDTFTKQRLLRRLSQFEGDLDGSEEGFVHSVSGQEQTNPDINEGSVAESSPIKPRQQGQGHSHTSSKVTSFGKGELDKFQFSEEASYDSSRSNSQDEDKENMSLPVLDPTTQTRFKFHLEPSPALDEEMVMTRRSRHTTTTNTTKRTINVRKTIRPTTSTSELSSEMPTSQRLEDLETPRKRNGDSEGKRLPKSPLKDPTPKRRRTLQNQDISELEVGDDSAGIDSLRETHQQMQSVIGKRKDARHLDDQQAANPKVLAMRQILRPRTPTPSQRSSQQNERPPLVELDMATIEKARVLQERRIAQIQAELDTTDPLRISAPLGASQQRDESRKGSVTTQDFLDEAKKIMAGIRGKARPRSGLTSVEESEAENDRNRIPKGAAEEEFIEDSYQESTQEPFSRPPSREGKPITRLPVMQEDPVILDHLRKYQEKSDMDDAIASSVRTMAMAKEAVEEAKEIERMTNVTVSRASGTFLTSGNILESEPSNIRISENPELQRKRKHSASSIPTVSEGSKEAEYPSHGSNASSSQSTTRSIPTGSSRGSDSRRVIAPHTVSHLIPEQLAGMVFDREKNIWFKGKSVSAESRGQGIFSADETEDDPFGDIPDLSVDETQERQRIKAVAAGLRQEAQSLSDNKNTPIATPSQPHNSTYQAPASNNPGQSPFNFDPSNLFGLDPGGTAPKTTNKSSVWENKQVNTTSLPVFHEPNKETGRKIAAQTKIIAEPTEEFESEISIHEDRVSETPRRRNVTISFSSPIASIINPVDFNVENNLERSTEEANSDSSGLMDAHEDSIIIKKRSSSHRETATSTRSSVRKASRGISIGRQTFSGRPVSRIDERDEEYSDEQNDEMHQRSVSVIVTTPAPKREVSMVYATPRLLHEIGNLSLTPLSDFTIHHEDKSFGLDVSYVAARQRYTLGEGQQRTLSLSIKALVERITEVEPYEPYWEDLKQIELREKRLTTLHKLDEFCGKIEDLDVSHNQISQLNGAPSSVRHLRMTHNCLTNLTAWNHLSNLQYIDISNNEIESLSGLKCLVHLRGLRADNNKITSLDGIGQLDGLLSLRLRGNMLESIDFSGTRLQRLTALDLKNNNIKDVQNIGELSSLSNLNLEDNQISSFSPNSAKLLWNLNYLRLAGNNLTSIDVSPFPCLRLLYLDRNRLGTVSGILKTKHLDSLSMREQQDGAIIDMAFLSQAFELRKLFLSGNLLPIFDPSAVFLNLQYLELANCGLKSLPSNFGQLFPNARVLNLNFNALKDLKPLHGIRRLKRLYLAGNRLASLRKVTSMLSQFSFLSTVDLRSNQLTLGFYPAPLNTALAVRKAVDGGEVLEPFTIGNVDSERDAKYVKCLDLETKMTRRVYQILVLGGCTRLKILDGLDVNKSTMDLRDGTWNTLVQSGVLMLDGNQAALGVSSEGSSTLKEPDEEPEPVEEPVREETWPAEDSFA
ncbi:Septation initiation network scaffold protein [Lachnellula hyalina]|uniref:Septation initiation network scaffold protein n=1 Tax=Lachnellula hyalina TaxID=1316788 RepID=A0A8H8QWN1_9HELO|nr:Septation initiation network scaffold protein [Lachnellula hyalina]TVY23540.1 Septation initiation network scaffold protein [Lachnellula hyalina]